MAGCGRWVGGALFLCAALALLHLSNAQNATNYCGDGIVNTYVEQCEGGVGCDSDCRCSANFTFSRVNGLCTPCPEGLVAPKGSTSQSQCASEEDTVANHHLYMDGASSFDVIGVLFDTSPFCSSSSGCWTIGVVYYGPCTADSQLFYLPKAESFETTRVPKNFPCSIQGYDPLQQSDKETICCWQNVSDDYTTLDTFGQFVEGINTSFPGDTCNGPTGSTLIHDAEQHYLEGSYAPGVSVAHLTDLFGGFALIRIEDDVLGTIGHSEQVEEGQGSFRIKTELFVGLAEFFATGTRILDSVHQQVAITLWKSSYGTVSARGTADYNFLTWINARGHRVWDEASGEYLYFATVSFLVDQGLQAAPGGLIPWDSVLVTRHDDEPPLLPGVPTRRHDLPGPSSHPSGVLPCEPNASRAFAEALAGVEEACGPAVEVCQSQGSLDAADRLGVINVPLHPEFVVEEEEVEIEFMVAVRDEEGAAHFVAVKLSLFTDEGYMFVQWCRPAADEVVGEVDLTAGVSLGMMVGVTERDLGELPLLPLRLLGESAADATSDSESVAGGLLSLLLDGETLLAPDLLVHLERVVTVHANGDAVALVDALADPVVVAFDFVSNTPSMTVSPQLAALCVGGPSAFLDGCGFRYDVVDRAPGPEALALDPADLSPVGSFIQHVSGASSPAAFDLGLAFGSLVATEFLVGRDRNAVFLVNPGYNWEGVAGTTIFTLSAKVYLFALFSVEIASAGGTPLRRGKRALLQTAAGSNGVSRGAARYDVDAAELTAAVLGVEEEVLLSLLVGLELEEELVCAEVEALKAEARARVLAAAGAVSGEVADVFIAKLFVDRAGVTCEGGRRTGESAGGRGPGMTAEVVGVFKHALGAEGFDLARFAAQEGIASAQKTDASPVSAADPPPLPSGAAEEGSQSTAAVAAAVAGGLVGSAVAAYGAVRLSRRFHPAQVADEEEEEQPYSTRRAELDTKWAWTANKDLDTCAAIQVVAISNEKP